MINAQECREQIRMGKDLKPLTLSGWAERIGNDKLQQVLDEAGMSMCYFGHLLQQNACRPAIYKKLSAAAQHCQVGVPSFAACTIATATFPVDVLGEAKAARRK
jgi:hypothetical protein